ncbi:hypothetical protein Golomagni_08208 [Golovinomyces magnicellulatus]|nr:hypothetical protein Golomagni_08208 [Golovinomyces magnicellulatus]
MPESATFQSKGIDIAADVFLPANAGSDPLPGVVISHPFGGVKEQTASAYAKYLADAGFVALVFDAAYNGASGGEPRYLEDPNQRVEDIKSAVSYLTTRKEVDTQRIGALGICASGGYVPFAASTDQRIKAVATVSAADMGSLFREGLGGGQSVDDLLAGLKKASDARTAEAAGEKPVLSHVVPNTPAEVPDGFPTLYKEGTDYYRTPRAQHPRSVNWFIERSLDVISTYSSFTYIDWISPRPLLMIAGSKADTLYFSERAIKAAKEPKELFLIDGKSHIDLYDDLSGAGPKLVDFLNKNL